MTFKGSGFFGFGAAVLEAIHSALREVVWDGTQDPTDGTLRNIGVRIGSTDGSPYDADDNEWDLNPNRGIRWHAAFVDWQNFALQARITQSNHNWAGTLFWGSTTSAIASDGDIRGATGAMGAWIGRPTTATADQFDTTGWNIMLVSSASDSGNPTIQATRVFNNAVNKTDVTKKHVQLPSSVLSGDGPHDFVFRQNHNNLEMYVNETRYAQWTLSDAHRDAAIGGYMGMSGDGSNVASKTLRISSFEVRYPYDTFPDNR